MHTGLQVDSMHFIAEAASQNTKPVQCYICLQFNHVAKYCKTKQQLCARCGDSHRMDQCIAANDAIKCSNCKGNHLATTNNCPKYKEQEKRMLTLVNQYSSTSKPATTLPAVHDANEFPSLPNIYQRQLDHLQNGHFDELFNAFTSKMEKIIEETTTRLFKSLLQRIKKIENTIASVENIINDDKMDSDSDSSPLSDDEIQIIPGKKTKQQSLDVSKLTKNKNTPTATSNTNNTTQPPTTTNYTAPKPPRKQKATAKTGKRNRSPNSSLDTTAMDSKDFKTNINED